MVLERIVRGDPELSFSQIADALSECTGLPTLHRSTLHDALASLGISLRLLRHEHRARQKALQDQAVARYQERTAPVPGPHRQAYPSDLTDAQWDLVAQALGPKLATLRTQDPRELINALLYQHRTGCQWAFLPHDFGLKWNSVFRTFKRWEQEGVWQDLMMALSGQSRQVQGRDEQPTVLLLDSQSVATTEKGDPAVAMATNESKDANDKC